MSRVAIHTLGCKLNFAESSWVINDLKERGFVITDFNSEADIYIIHSCSVTSEAEKKTRHAIARARKQNPNANVVVMGCYAQLQPDELMNLSGVDMALGNEQKFRLGDILSSGQNNLSEEDKNPTKFHAAYSFNDRTRSFLKIQDGCDYFCAYCTIPHARGRSRSSNIADVLKQIETIAQSGFQEVVLTGVNAADFGKGSDENFSDLMQAIDNKGANIRIRLSSIEPDLLTDETIQLVAASKVIMPHFHLPLQSGSDSLLKRMRRRYDTSLFEQKTTLIHQLIPDACIAADVITGFPGETDQEFEDTYNFIKKLPLSYVHVFTYSDRPMAAASRLENKIAPAIKKQRTRQLLDLSEQKKLAFYQGHLGKTMNALIEGERKNGLCFGFTNNYIRIAIPAQAEHINQVVQVRLDRLSEDGQFINAHVL